MPFCAQFLKGGNEAPLHIEEWRIHAKPKFKRRAPQKSRHSAVTWLLSGIPDNVVARKIAVFFPELIGTGLNLLQAQNVGLPVPGPPERVLA